MRSTRQVNKKKQGRGRPPLSSNVTIEAVRKEQLDMGKLAQAVEQYIRYIAELCGGAKPTQGGAGIASITPVLSNVKTNTPKSIKITGHSIERKR